MPTRRECANAIRALSVDAIEKAKSGHPGAPLGMADMAEALWGHFLKHNPADPSWPDRDRFILSNGHASMLLYSLLHLTGYNLPKEEIANFRQWGSKTPGHPERGLTPGVEMSTGPLGQGIASAVGFALAESLLATRFNKPNFKIVDHFTYVFCGEGCLMEGISHEACSLAGTWRLGKLIVFFDANGVSIDGDVSAWFSENVAKRYEAYGWQIIGPVDGHDSEALDAAIAEARSDVIKPSLIICRTHIGFGSPKRDTSASHGAPLGAEAAEQTKQALDWHYAPFEVPREIYEKWDAREKGAQEQEKWSRLFKSYEKKWPGEAAEFKRRTAGEMPDDWPHIVLQIMDEAEKHKEPLATRVCSRGCLEILVHDLPEMIGGSADLSGSVGTQTSSSISLDPEKHSGNYLHYGAREFGMGAIMNGLAMHGGFIPYAGTFLAFSDQAKNALRLSAIMGLHVIWVMSHDSIGVGEDGPTHQPIEQISSLRLIPGLRIWRPCDYEETAQAWISAVSGGNIPSCLILSRQKLSQISRDPVQIAEISKGGYILRDCECKPDIILLATGSEVCLAVEGAEKLSKGGYKCRVVSMPCMEIFDAQSEEWRNSVLPPDVRCRLAVEAGSPEIWNKYTGLDGAVIGMDKYGASASGGELFERYGFTAANIVEKARNLLKKAK